MEVTHDPLTEYDIFLICEVLKDRLAEVNRKVCNNDIAQALNDSEKYDIQTVLNKFTNPTFGQ